MSKEMKDLRKQTLLLGLCFIIVGIILVSIPEITLATIAIIVGIAAAIVGIVRVVGYFVKKNDGEERPSLAGGLLLIALAIFIFTKPGLITTILYIILGFAIIANGVTKLQAGITMKRQANKYWVVVLISALVTIALGFIVLFGAWGPATLIILIGIFMIIGGVLDVIAALFLKSAAKKIEE
ncbi:MAG: hypothetical protein HN389_06790 [Clostridia bacterium]|jgi:uncharacterized membrane protein HdeD (DUF308 family)|nr:hypothetical protein [Clostridia bacterium]